MPPKKKGGGKKGKGKGKKGKKGKGKGKKGGDQKGLVPVEMMSNPELIDYINGLRDELEREREEKNYFQLERDKINTFFEITKRQLQDKKTEVRNRERELEEAEEKHQKEIKAYKQKVKYLLYEHQTTIAQMKAENIVNMKTLEDRIISTELEFKKDKRALKLELRGQETAHAHVIQDLKKKHDAHCTQLLLEYKRELKEVEKMYEIKMGAIRDELELRHKMAVHEIEERKNEHINTLIKNHEKECSDASTFYNDITLNNISLINHLRDQLEELKKKEARMAKDMRELEDTNRRMVDPLERTKRKIGVLKIQLANYEKDKEKLKTHMALVKSLTGDLQTIRWENELLEQSSRKTRLERDELYNKFVEAIQDVQQKCSFKNLLLEKKLSALVEMLEKRESQLNEVLSLSKLDPSSLSLITRKLETVLASKNSAIKELQYELARACKAHNDLLRTCETKLNQFGIPKENLGFKPLENRAGGQSLGSGPAGLVSDPR